MPAHDGTLVLGVLNGDRSAFAELYDRRARLIRAVCYDATHDLDAAADLTQEVFLRAYRRLRTLRDSHKFSPWLVGIARQVCREWRRGKLRESLRMERFAQGRRPEDEVVAPPDERLIDLRAALAEPESISRHDYSGTGSQTQMCGTGFQPVGSPAGCRCHTHPVGHTDFGCAKLTAKERLALHAFYLQGQDADEARGVLGLSRSGFYRVLSSAVERLRKVLVGVEVKP